MEFEDVPIKSILPDADLIAAENLLRSRMGEVINLTAAEMLHGYDPRKTITYSAPRASCGNLRMRGGSTMSNTWEEFIDTPLANLADQITALSGDNVPPMDDTQRLLSALRRAGFLDKHETMRLQALYLNRKPETWQQMAERLGVEVTEIGNVTFRKGRVPNVALGVSCYLTLQGSSAPRIDTMSNIHLNQPDAPRKARDLSACLQVAARYLEEVEQ